MLPYQLAMIKMYAYIEKRFNHFNSIYTFEANREFYCFEDGKKYMQDTRILLIMCHILI